MAYYYICNLGLVNLDAETMPDPEPPVDLYCPACKRPVADPLVCGDCHAVICRECGTPLERVDDLGIG